MSDLSIANLKAKKFGKSRSESRETQAGPQPTPQVRQETNACSNQIQDQRQAQNRHISKGVKHQVWLRDKGKCLHCGGTRNLNYDHIRPVALGGSSNPDNIRILCFHCNQRAAIRVFSGRETLALQKID